MTTNKFRRLTHLVLVLLSFSFDNAAGQGPESDADYQKRLDSHAALFHHSDDIEALGPNVFPKPTDHAKHAIANNEEDIFPYMKPYFGSHRPDKDAVFAFAAEYGLGNYVCFVQSLRNTGFDGDIVLSVSPLDVENKRVWSYLKEVPGIVIYVPKLVCYNYEMEQVASAKGGMRTCQCDDLYGHRPHGSTTLQPLKDPRPPRTIATTRYEIYWIMVQNYHPHSWILLVDARDTYFQSDPFAPVPRQTDPTAKSGLLYFFGENAEATRLGKSKTNNKWLRTAYGEIVGNHMADKPTICSGASMGEQVALETYTRAMVAESDDTGTVLMGADQGFHNFLYYSHKFKNADQIHDIVLFDQGTGIVNNMGALRTKPLEEWGNGKIVREFEEDGRTRYEVLNWDGTLTPVVHQFDRHKKLSDYFFKTKTDEMIAEWRQRSK